MSEEPQVIPRHIAIIMDGNGRWAKKRFLIRTAGHKAGVESVKDIVKACAKRGVEVLTLFAFGQDNWARPEQEVSFIMELMLQALQKEVKELHRNDIRLKFIGDLSALSPTLQEYIQQAVTLTQNNQRMTLVLALNYSGRWDITQAVKQMAQRVAAGELTEHQIDQQYIIQSLQTANLPDPDLFIRTGGELRISNFMLWQLSYSELYFSDVHWPEFRETHLLQAIMAYNKRQRRYGQTPEQIEE